MDAALTVSFSPIAYEDLVSGFYNRNMLEDMLKNRYKELSYRKSQIINEKYDELAQLKVTIEETRDKLNDLVSVKQNHLSEDILDLSRKLDRMIYRYMALEKELESKV